MGNVTGIIRNVIGVLVVMAAIAITWPVQMIAVDGFYKKFVNHCTVGGAEYTRLYTRVDNTEDLDLTRYLQFTFTNASLADADCGTAAEKFTGSTLSTKVVVVGDNTTDPLAAGDKLYNEHNERIVNAVITTASSVDSVQVTNSKLKKPMPILLPYASISTVILGAIPVLSSVTFIGAAGFSLYKEQGSSEGVVSMQVLYTIGALIAVIVVLFAMPILLGFFNIAYVASGGANIESGPWETTEQFGSIISIVFEMSPVLAILSSMTGFALLGYNQIRGKVGMMMGG